MKKKLGHIIAGSLTEGFELRICPETDLETIKTGKFVSIVGNSHRFFSLITDLKLQVTHPDILLFPPTPQEKLLSTILKQKDIYAIAQLKPMLMLGADNKPSPVKTIPSHFCAVYEATSSDVAMIKRNWVRTTVNKLTHTQLISGP